MNYAGGSWGWSPRSTFATTSVKDTRCSAAASPISTWPPPWANRVRRADARYAGTRALPVVGAVPAPSAVLVRLDGHVAWVGDGPTEGLQAALLRWFGSATA
ncbi:Uncharacterised protein [Ralstonia pickettii]|uniref:aromatic-ring hydroxylase C-terminal domain-containing protein n=1 Tax=Ralstonia TaxID=48736 RepID=UPI000563F675|nr:MULTISPECIES: hypothetical protein [Ralstonia]MBU6522061.1 hypothetical protein [Ralstonia sp. B265]QQK33890.1 hypothetical protein RP6297_00072 [Ralstonia pickettii]SUE00973.1 Uncharacterised protein [Ralstonia pickettii]